MRWRLEVSCPSIAYSHAKLSVFPSEMQEGIMGKDKDFRVEGAMPTNQVPLTRVGREEEVAGTVLYFASPAGAYCSGTIHVIDGGRLGVMPGTTY